jgi:hypothetical protein
VVADNLVLLNMTDNKLDRNIAGVSQVRAVFTFCMACCCDLFSGRRAQCNIFSDAWCQNNGVRTVCARPGLPDKVMLGEVTCLC